MRDLHEGKHGTKDLSIPGFVFRRSNVWGGICYLAGLWPFRRVTGLLCREDATCDPGTVPLNTVAILGVLFTIVSTFLARRDRFSFYLVLAASICVTAATLITAFGNVPIINQIMTWSINSPPSNWMEVGEKWVQFQAVRTILQTAALAFLVLSTLFSSRYIDIEGFELRRTTRVSGRFIAHLSV